MAEKKLSERIDALFQQIDQVRMAISKELTVLRAEDLVHATKHLCDVPAHLFEADAELDRAMDDLCAAACAAHRGGM